MKVNRGSECVEDETRHGSEKNCANQSTSEPPRYCLFQNIASPSPEVHVYPHLV